MMWLMRLSRLARRPPSGNQLKIIIAIAALCLVFYGIEQIWGWPEWLKVERARRPRF